MTASKKVNFFDWVQEQTNVSKADLTDASTNPIIHFAKQGKYIQGTYNGLPVYRDKSFESTIHDGSTWICSLKRHAGTNGSQCYFATPIKEIDENFFFALNESNQSVIADYLYEYYRTEIIDAIGEIEGSKKFTSEMAIDMDRQIKEKDLQISKLNKELESKETEIQKAKDTRKDSADKVKESKEELQTLQKELDETKKTLKKTSEELQSSVNRYDTDMRLANEKIDSLTKENEKMKVARDAIEAARLRNEQEEKAATIENKSLKSNIKSLNGTIIDMDVQIRELTVKDRNNRDTIRNLNAKIASMEEALQKGGDNQAEIAILREELKQKSSVVEERDAEIARLNATVERMKKEPRQTGSNFSGIVDAFSKQIEEFEKENSELKEKVRIQENEIGELRNRTETDSSASQKLKEQNEAMRKELEDLRTAVESLTRANTELKDANALLMSSEPSKGQECSGVKIVWKDSTTFVSDWFTDGRYKALINPESKAVRFVRSEKGTIESKDGALRLNGIGEIALFTGERVLESETDSAGGVTVALV